MTEDENDKKCSKSFKIILYKNTKIVNQYIHVFTNVTPLNVCPQPESVFCSIDLEHLEYLANQKTFFDSNLRMTAKIHRSVLNEDGQYGLLIRYL